MISINYSCSFFRFLNVIFIGSFSSSLHTFTKLRKAEVISRNAVEQTYQGFVSFSLYFEDLLELRL